MGNTVYTSGQNIVAGYAIKTKFKDISDGITSRHLLAVIMTEVIPTKTKKQIIRFLSVVSQMFQDKLLDNFG